MTSSQQSALRPELSDRQAMVLRATVTAYLGEGVPIGSTTVSHLLPMSLSSASIRNTMADLAGLGLIEKPHASSGRVPTELGLRVFVDELLDPGDLAAYEKRSLAWSVDEASPDDLASVASALLSERTRLLGFALPPRIEQAQLHHVSLVRLSTERLLAVLVGESGVAQRVVVERGRPEQQRELDRMSHILSERVAGRTLPQVRAALAHEAHALRDEADRLLARAIDLGRRVLAESPVDPADLVIATRLALLDQPEFQDPRRIRDLFAALEDRERLLDIIDQVLAAGGLRVAFGAEVGEPALRHCALVVTPYGGDPPLGALGVIGPQRMDFGRVIPLVGYLSGLVTEKLNA